MVPYFWDFQILIFETFFDMIGSTLAYAKVQHDIYYCHDDVDIEFPVLLPDSSLQFSREPEIHIVNREHILCAVNLIKIMFCLF